VSTVNSKSMTQSYSRCYGYDRKISRNELEEKYAELIGSTINLLGEERMLSVVQSLKQTDVMDS